MAGPARRIRRAAGRGRARRRDYLGDEVDAIGRDELIARLRKGDVVLVDVRPAEEFAAGHIEGARSIPIDELEGRLAELPADREVVAYCRGPFCAYAHDAVRQPQAAGRRRGASRTAGRNGSSREQRPIDRGRSLDAFQSLVLEALGSISPGTRPVWSLGGLHRGLRSPGRRMELAVPSRSRYPANQSGGGTSLHVYPPVYSPSRTAIPPGGIDKTGQGPRTAHLSAPMRTPRRGCAPAPSVISTWSPAARWRHERRLQARRLRRRARARLRRRPRSPAAASTSTPAAPRPRRRHGRDGRRGAATARTSWSRRPSAASPSATEG